MATAKEMPETRLTRSTLAKDFYSYIRARRTKSRRANVVTQSLASVSALAPTSIFIIAPIPTEGCYYTGNHNADLAAAWIIENQHRNLDGPLEEDLDFDDEEGEEEDFPEGLELYKMVFVVNADLGMDVGKAGAQCSQAALALYRIMVDNPERFGTMMMAWKQFGETKIVLRGENTAQLVDLAKKAENAALPICIVQDAGRNTDITEPERAND